MNIFYPLLLGLFLWLNGQAWAQSPRVTELAYPAVKHAITHFSVLTDGLVLLPLGGGVFVPGQQLWYYPPAKKQIIYSACPGFADKSLYAIVQSGRQPEVMKLSRNDQGLEEFEQITALPKGLFVVFPVGKDRCYLWGFAAGRYGVWFQRGSKRDTLFTSTRNITAFAPVGEQGYFLAHSQAVYWLQSGQPPQKITQFSGTVDGLAIGTDGTLFVSLPEGIVRIRDKKHVDLVAKDIHGYLQWHGQSLYVLDQPRNRVLQLHF